MNAIPIFDPDKAE